MYLENESMNRKCTVLLMKFNGSFIVDCYGLHFVVIEYIAQLPAMLNPLSPVFLNFYKYMEIL